MNTNTTIKKITAQLRQHAACLRDTACVIFLAIAIAMMVSNWNEATKQYAAHFLQRYLPNVTDQSRPDDSTTQPAADAPILGGRMWSTGEVKEKSKTIRMPEETPPHESAPQPTTPPQQERPEVVSPIVRKPWQPRLPRPPLPPQETPPSAPVVPPAMEEKTAPKPPPAEEKRPAAPEDDGFPAFGYTLHPVARVPNWGAMRSPAQWNRTYAEMSDADYVAIPSYNLTVLMRPLVELARDPIPPENYPAITTKLYYSTRYFGRYDLDSGEFEAPHSGIDLKLAMGTPIGTIAGGRVHKVGEETSVGRFIMIEHHVPGEGIFFSIYGHLDSTWVKEGDAVTPGQPIGTVGMTGNTTAPHIHLQVDRDRGTRPHVRYQPENVPSPAEAASFAVHPIEFIRKHARR